MSERHSRSYKIQSTPRFRKFAVICAHSPPPPEASHAHQSSYPPRVYFLLLLPVLIAAAAIAAELAIKSSGGVSRAFDERIKKVIEMDTELAKWFIGLGATLIGAAAYYVRARTNELALPTLLSRVAIVLPLFGAVASIFFGHLCLANMRDMVSNDYFDAKSPALIWPERGQYFSFLASVRESACGGV